MVVYETHLASCGFVNRLYFLEHYVFTVKLSGKYRVPISLTLPHTFSLY